MSATIHEGDWIDVLRTLPDCSVHCVVTSPPYWGLRDYGMTGQLGLERTPEEYVAKMVEGFREVRRALRDDGTCWVNLGDSYAGSWGNYHPNSPPGKHGQRVKETARWNRPAYSSQEFLPPTANIKSCKPKDLVGIPWMVAFALRADGWYLRQDIIWAKPNPMPESVTDRCTKSHEYIFLLTKSARYWYDQDAIREPHIWADDPRNDGQRHTYADDAKHNQCDPDRQRTKTDCVSFHPNGKNKRSVWNVSTNGYAEAHFATFPPEIPEICIKAGCPEGGTVLDPFCGAGTTGMVAKRLMRSFIGIELNPAYVEMARRRIESDAPLFNEVTIESTAVTGAL